MPKTLIKLIRHYKRSIKHRSNDKKRLLHCVRKLYFLPITFKNLQESGIGATVKSIKRIDGDLDERVNALLTKWNALVPSIENDEMPNSDTTESDDSPQITSSADENGELKATQNGHGICDDDRPRKKKRCSKRSKLEKRKRWNIKYFEKHNRRFKRHRLDKKNTETELFDWKLEDEEKCPSVTSSIASNPVLDFENGTSSVFNPELFPPKENLKPLDFSLIADLHTTNLSFYNSSPLNLTNFNTLELPSYSHSFNESKAFLDGISSKTNRTKVYAGVKRIKITQPKTLLEICIGNLQKQIGGLKYTKKVPFDILKPILELATPEQLLKLEDLNPYLKEDSDSLWLSHVKRNYSRQPRLETETSREMFLRCQYEKTHNLKKLTEKFHKKRFNKTEHINQLFFGDPNSKEPEELPEQAMKKSVGKAKSVANDFDLKSLKDIENGCGKSERIPSKGENRKRQHNGEKAKAELMPRFSRQATLDEIPTIPDASSEFVLKTLKKTKYKSEKSMRKSSKSENKKRQHKGDKDAKDAVTQSPAMDAEAVSSDKENANEKSERKLLKRKNKKRQRQGDKAKVVATQSPAMNAEAVSSDKENASEKSERKSLKCKNKKRQHKGDKDAKGAVTQSPAMDAESAFSDTEVGSENSERKSLKRKNKKRDREREGDKAKVVATQSEAAFSDTETGSEISGRKSPKSKNKKRQHKGVKAKVVATQSPVMDAESSTLEAADTSLFSLPATQVNSETTKESKLDNARLRMIKAFKNTKRARAEKPKKAPLMIKTMKLMRQLQKQPSL